MPVVKVQITDTASERLGKISPSARAALLRVVRPMSEEMAADVRSRAVDHIHTLGTKPGLYLASIYSGVYDKAQRIGGFARSGSPLAHLLEGGANLPAHSIEAKAADALMFTGSAGDVWRKAVQHPGARIPPYPAFGPAIDAKRDEIAARLTAAVREAARDVR